MCKQSVLLLSSLLVLTACGLVGGDKRQISRAESALSSGQYNEAVVLLRNVTSKDSKNGSAQLLLARAQLMRGEMLGANEALASAVAADADAAAVAELRADFALRAGRAAELLQDLDGGKLALPKRRLDYYRAVALQSTGQFVQALIIYESLLKADPASADIAVHAAECHAALGRRDVSLAAVNKVLAAHADSASAWALRARLLQVKPDPAEARTSLQQAIAHAPGQMSVPEQLALFTIEAGFAVDRGELKATQAVHEKLVQLVPQAPLADLLGAQISVQKGNADEAVNSLQRLMQQAPDVAATRPALIGALLAAGNIEQAVFESGKLEDGKSDEARFRAVQLAIKQAASSAAGSEARALQSAAAAIMLKQSAAARSLLDQGLQDHPESLPLQSAGIEMRLRVGKVDEALQRARALQQRKPDDPAVMNIMASALAIRGDAAGAAAQYERLWKVAPSARIATMLSQFRQRTGSADAVQPLASWVASHPQDLAARAMLASAYQESGEVDKARAEYEKVIEAQPQEPVVLNNLAGLYQRSGDRRGLALAKRAYDLAPRIPSIADTYGWLLAESGDPLRAEPILQAAVRGAPENPEIRFHLASTLLRAGGDSRSGAARDILVDLLRDERPSETRVQAERLLATLKQNAP